jgi:hypothetical protein
MAFESVHHFVGGDRRAEREESSRVASAGA